MANIGIYTTLFWPASTTNGVALLQDVAEDGAVILNGALANPYYPNDMSFTARGFKRSVSITSANDLSATQSEVRGMINGLEVIEVIDNPDNDTTTGIESFDSITEIIVTGGDADGISFGVGFTGYFNPINVNTAAGTISGSTMQLILYTGTAEYSIYQTIDKDVIGTGVSFDDLVINGTYKPLLNSEGMPVTGDDSDIFYNTPFELNSSFLIEITDSDEAASIKLIYLQV
jgi:hypothetical protein